MLPCLLQPGCIAQRSQGGREVRRSFGSAWNEGGLGACLFMDHTSKHTAGWVGAAYRSVRFRLSRAEEQEGRDKRAGFQAFAFLARGGDEGGATEGAPRSGGGGRGRDRGGEGGRRGQASKPRPSPRGTGQGGRSGRQDTYAATQSRDDKAATMGSPSEATSILPLHAHRESETDEGFVVDRDHAVHVRVVRPERVRHHRELRARLDELIEACTRTRHEGTVEETRVFVCGRTGGGG